MTQLDKIESLVQRHIEMSTKQNTEILVSVGRIQENMKSGEKRMNDFEETQKKHTTKISALQVWKNIHHAAFFTALSSWFK